VFAKLEKGQRRNHETCSRVDVINRTRDRPQGTVVWWELRWESIWTREGGNFRNHYSVKRRGDAQSENYRRQMVMTLTMMTSRYSAVFAGGRLSSGRAAKVSDSSEDKPKVLRHNVYLPLAAGKSFTRTRRAAKGPGQPRPPIPVYAGITSH